MVKFDQWRRSGRERCVMTMTYDEALDLHVVICTCGGEWCGRIVHGSSADPSREHGEEIRPHAG